MLTLIDSPFANLDSIARGLRSVGAELEVSRDPEVVARSRQIVLPGVGSFATAMNWLTETGVADAIRTAVDSQSSLFGICLGHQLLFDESEEMGQTSGLGLIAGRVRRFPSSVRVPKIGWNQVDAKPDFLFHGIPDGSSFYFVHSYRVEGVSMEHEVATAEYGGRFNVAARRENVCGVQFHPEKSSRAGLRLLENFVKGVVS
ncbi:MAG TPA: imidazole glycerol phosphate synthase subunit HisH [Thermoanaerobaculia bacterium]|nr:imidazole glycerol phosphate synthase subunit HisH [Thermoanaerobaculia bacterium]